MFPQSDREHGFTRGKESISQCKLWFAHFSSSPIFELIWFQRTRKCAKQCFAWFNKHMENGLLDKPQNKSQQRRKNTFPCFPTMLFLLQPSYSLIKVQKSSRPKSNYHFHKRNPCTLSYPAVKKSFTLVPKSSLLNLHDIVQIIQHRSKPFPKNRRKKTKWLISYSSIKEWSSNVHTIF